MKKHLRFPGPVGWFLVILIFAICLTGAYSLPVDSCPDERGRLYLTDYITKTWKLPTGTEPETMLDLWHFSYGLFPYLSSMVGAFFAKVFGRFIPIPEAYIIGSRMCSVLSITGCFLFSLLLGGELFSSRSSAILYAVILCFTPQVLFLGMYQNNDALSLFAVSVILYFLVRGRREHWNVKNCVYLAAGISVCLLSYYSVYPWILFAVVFCCVSCILDDTIQHKGSFILKRSGLTFTVVLALAGWFFIRNAVIHNGDFLGLATKGSMKAQALAEGAVLPNRIKRDLGYSFKDFFADADCDWLRFTLLSLVGRFGYMNIPMPLMRTHFYFLILLAGIVGYCVSVRRKKPDTEGSLVFLMMLLSSLSVIALSLYYSYCIDYQPQGRYVITVLFLLSYMLTHAANGASLFTFKRTGRAIRVADILSAVWIFLALKTAFDTMSKMV